jgi:Ca-activated chloride channel family protein
MSFKRAVPVALAALVVASVPVLVGGQQPIFRSGTELVDLYVTVTDDEGRLVPNLLQDQFVIFDEKKPQEIALFEQEVRPISVVVMLDTSISTDLVMPLIKAGAEQFLIRMLPDDRARVGAFNDKIQIEPPQFTGDRDLLISQLSRQDFGNSTRLWDAIDASLDALAEVEGRKVILVLTDGDDSGSNNGRGDVLDRAIAEDVMVYAIGLEVEYFNGAQWVRSRPESNLRKLARETGGGFFLLEETDELGPTFTRVSQELHSQYVLGFTPTERDGKVHELEVRVAGKDMEARARRSYVAPSSSDN